MLFETLIEMLLRGVIKSRYSKNFENFPQKLSHGKFCF